VQHLKKAMPIFLKYVCAAGFDPTNLERALLFFL